MMVTTRTGSFMLWVLALAVAGCAQPETSAPEPAAPMAANDATGAMLDETAGVDAPIGRNDRFLSDDLDVDRFIGVFESETREVALVKEEIVAAMGLRPGETVADVGSGTGLFLDALCDAVGQDGEVIAVEISPRFGEHLEQRIADEGLAQARVVMCDERSSNLEPNSVDCIFVCDTYHHFDYPADTLASLHAALREGGRLVIVDFERKPGVSSDWVLDHMRAGKEAFIDEISGAGFRLAHEVWLAQFRLTYMLVFDRER